MKILLNIIILLFINLCQNSFSFDSSTMEFCTREPNQKKCESINVSTKLRALIAMKDHWACQKKCENFSSSPDEYKQCKEDCLITQELAATKFFGLNSCELSELLKEFEKSHPGSKLHDLYKEKTEK